MKLIKKLLVLLLCISIISSISGCSIVGLGLMADPEGDGFTEEEKDDAEAVKNLFVDIFDIAADKYKEHFGEIDIGDAANSVDRDKIADGFDIFANFIKDGIELWDKLLNEEKPVDQSPSPSETTPATTTPTE
jgi:hypothetical protein